MDKIKSKLLGLLLIPIFSYGQEFVSVCDRTPQVKDAIMEIVREIDDSIECSDTDLMKLMLSEIEALDLEGGGSGLITRVFVENIASLKPGDFSGLSSLRQLDLSSNNLTTLPEGIFSGLISLNYLFLRNNNLTTLPQGLFSGLASLEEISMSENNLASLPEGLFSGLASLDTLYLYENNLTSLPQGIFSGLASSLKNLGLDNNKLTSLPEGLFSGFSLENLWIRDNPLNTQTRQYLQSLNIPDLRL